MLSDCSLVGLAFPLYYLACWSPLCGEPAAKQNREACDKIDKPEHEPTSISGSQLTAFPTKAR